MPVRQAWGWSLYQMRRRWQKSDVAHHLPSIGGGYSTRPRWQDSTDTWFVADTAVARDSLRNNLRSWCRRFADGGSPDCLAAAEWVGLFEDRVSEWVSADLPASVWIEDWSGKEILQCLLTALSHVHGWPVSGGGRASIAWDPMSRAAREAKLREIEATLRRYLVESLLAYLGSDPSTAAAGEWRSLADMARAAVA